MYYLERQPGLGYRASGASVRLVGVPLGRRILGLHNCLWCHLPHPETNVNERIARIGELDRSSGGGGHDVHFRALTSPHYRTGHRHPRLALITQLQSHPHKVTLLRNSIYFQSLLCDTAHDPDGDHTMQPE